MLSITVILWYICKHLDNCVCCIVISYPNLPVRPVILDIQYQLKRTSLRPGCSDSSDCRELVSITQFCNLRDFCNLATNNHEVTLFLISSHPIPTAFFVYFIPYQRPQHCPYLLSIFSCLTKCFFQLFRSRHQQIAVLFDYSFKTNSDLFWRHDLELRTWKCLRIKSPNFSNTASRQIL